MPNLTPQERAKVIAANWLAQMGDTRQVEQGFQYQGKDYLVSFFISRDFYTLQAYTDKDFKWALRVTIPYDLDPDLTILTQTLRAAMKWVRGEQDG